MRFQVPLWSNMVSYTTRFENKYILKSRIWALFNKINLFSFCQISLIIAMKQYSLDISILPQRTQVSKGFYGRDYSL